MGNIYDIMFVLLLALFMFILCLAMYRNVGTWYLVTYAGDLSGRGEEGS